MNWTIIRMLAQMPDSKLEPNDPRLNAEPSNGLTWVIVVVLLLGILAVTFKMSKRTAAKGE